MTVDSSMIEFTSYKLVHTWTLDVSDVVCRGTCRPPSAEESTESTRFVFPYGGVYVHHVGRKEAFADPNQVLFLNGDEPYRISHPLAGGDSSLSIGVSAATLLELTPREWLQGRDRPALNRSRLHIDAKTQALAAKLRHRLRRGTIDDLEAETLTLNLIGRALGQSTPDLSPRNRKLVDRVKLVLASDVGRRRTLAEVAAEVGGSPVYLTQVFQRVEGIPLYRYQLQLRLARALELLHDCDDVTDLALTLGFSSHSHFSASFKQAFGQTPSAFRRSARVR